MIHFTRIGVLAVAAAAALWAGAAAAQELKIGYVNSERVLREATPAKAAQSKLEVEFSKREKELNEQGARLKARRREARQGSARAERSRAHAPPARTGRAGPRPAAQAPRVPGRPEPAQERRAGRGRRARQPRDQADLRSGEVRPDPAGGDLRRAARRHHRQGHQGAQRGARRDDGALTTPWRVPDRVAPVTTVRLADIVAALGGELHGDPELPIDAHRRARQRRRSVDHRFWRIARHADKLARTGAGCVIVAPALRRGCAARAARPS